MLHHLPRQARQQAVREMRRVLKPGGRLFVVDFAGTSPTGTGRSFTSIAMATSSPVRSSSSLGMQGCTSSRPVLWDDGSCTSFSPKAYERNSLFSNMDITRINPALAAILSELVDGASKGRDAFVLNSGDLGLTRSLDKLSAHDASRSANGGATVAADAQHLRDGLSLMNRWGATAAMLSQTQSGTKHGRRPA